MKKLLMVISAAAALFCGMMLTSCDALDDDFVAPKDTWVYKTGTGDNSFTYSWTSGETTKSVNFDVYVDYATTESTLSFKNSGTAKVEPGFNVILVPDADTDSDTLKELIDSTESVTGDIAFFHAFGTTAEASSSDSAADQSFNFSGSAWTLIYNFNKFESMGSKSMSNTTANMTVVNSTSTMNWKRILYNMLGDKILGE